MEGNLELISGEADGSQEWAHKGNPNKGHSLDSELICVMACAVSQSLIFSVGESQSSFCLPVKLQPISEEKLKTN